MAKKKKHNKVRKHWPRGIKILFEDNDIIVVDKAPGLLTIGTEKIRHDTCYARLTEYVKKGQAKSKARVFVVHRLDRATSGILVFAKNVEAKKRLQMNWSDVEKVYVAVVEGHPLNDDGEFQSYLAESKAFHVYSTEREGHGKLAVSKYQVEKRSETRSLLRLALTTGRKHQLRVQLADAGLPIVGDKKYGDGGAARRMALHAYQLSFDHPTTGEAMVHTTTIPPYFFRLLKEQKEEETPSERREQPAPAENAQAPAGKKKKYHRGQSPEAKARQRAQKKAAARERRQQLANKEWGPR